MRACVHAPGCARWRGVGSARLSSSAPPEHAFDALWVWLEAQLAVKVHDWVDGGWVGGRWVGGRVRVEVAMGGGEARGEPPAAPPPPPATTTHTPNPSRRRRAPLESAKRVMLVMSRRSSVRTIPSTSALPSPRPCMWVGGWVVGGCVGGWGGGRGGAERVWRRRGAGRVRVCVRATACLRMHPRLLGGRVAGGRGAPPRHEMQPNATPPYYQPT